MPTTASTWRLVRDRDMSDQTSVTEQRARAFSAGLGPKRVATLLVRRTDDGLEYYLSIPDEGAASPAAANLAASVGAQLEPVPTLPDLSTVTSVATAHLSDKGHLASRATQVGADLSEVARVIADVLPLGSWIALTLRQPSKNEMRRWRTWLAHKMSTPNPTHYSVDTGAMVATFSAGAHTTNAARDVLTQVMAALPGFDLQVESKTLSPWREATFPLLATIPVIALMILGLISPAVAIPTAAALLLAGVAFVVGWLPTAASTRMKGLASGHLPQPRKRHGRVVKPRAEKRTMRRDKDGVEQEHIVRAREGTYPIPLDAFMIAPHQAACILAPQAGALSGASVARGDHVAVPLTRDIGPFIGRGPGGEAIHLSATDMWSGVSVFGKPGSGKSILSQIVLAWTMANKTSPTHRPGYPGARQAIVSFETKLDGAQDTLAWGKALGSDIVITSLSEQTHITTPAIDLLGPGNVAEQAEHFVASMTYAFRDGSILHESRRTLIALVAGGLAVTDDIVDIAGSGIAKGQPFTYYAYILSGAAGDEVCMALAGAIHSQVEAWEVSCRTSQTPTQGNSTAPAAVEAWEQMKFMFSPDVTPSARKAFQKAPGNKVHQLASAGAYFSPHRPRYSFAQVLEEAWNVVIHTGATAQAEELEDDVTEMLAGMLMFELHQTIRRLCAGWKDQGRGVTISCDELAVVAGSNERVLTWLRNQGRSYGVSCLFATQEPKSLGADLVHLLMGFGTLVGFAQNSREIADQIAKELQPWEGEDLVRLPKYHAVMRASVDEVSLPPVSLATAYWGRGDTLDVDAFRSDQRLAPAPGHSHSTHPSTQPWPGAEA